MPNIVLDFFGNFNILCYFGPILNHFGPIITIFNHFVGKNVKMDIVADTMFLATPALDCKFMEIQYIFGGTSSTKFWANYIYLQKTRKSPKETIHLINKHHKLPKFSRNWQAKRAKLQDRGKSCVRRNLLVADDNNQTWF